MVNRRTSNVIHHLGRLVGRTGHEDRPDAQLLARFAAQHDQTAFAALLHRHGRLVLGVCQRVLQDSHAAEDAFQAVFLVLARKAGTLDGNRPLAGWLFTVAYRMAQRVRVAAQRQRHCQEQAAMRNDSLHNDPGNAVSNQEFTRLLDEEIHRLPEKYRMPLVPCCLEGKSHEDAARELGVPRGSMARRLEGAKERLRRRLESRGLTLTGAALATLLADSAEAAVVSGSLAQRTAVGAVAFAAGSAELASASIAALAEGMLQCMAFSKLKILAVALLVVAVGGTLFACYGLARGTGARMPAEAPASPDQLAQAEPGRVRLRTRWRILDHAGVPVPNVTMRLVAYTKGGQPHGDDQAWWAGVTNAKGQGEMTLMSVAPQPGYLELEGVHPSIGTVRKRVEWAHLSSPPAPGREEIIEIRAMAGPGLADWREACRGVAPDLVRELLAAADDEVSRLQEHLIKGEGASLPALVAAAEDYDHPKRHRLVRAIRVIVNMIHGTDYVDARVLAKAAPIFAVDTFAVVFREKPSMKPRFDSACVKELEWTIARLGRDKENTDLAAALKEALADIRKQ